ncbi:hypothetical protein GE09DRAFT_13879 [Coniochaeta sp. 2T2.1]|nr:hypothetical protein GE09DRAFT_13879 [Coniochaeta sp. 2T2.1]
MGPADAEADVRRLCLLCFVNVSSAFDTAAFGKVEQRRTSVSQSRGVRIDNFLRPTSAALCDAARRYRHHENVEARCAQADVSSCVFLRHHVPLNPKWLSLANSSRLQRSVEVPGRSSSWTHRR